MTDSSTLDAPPPGGYLLSSCRKEGRLPIESLRANRRAAADQALRPELLEARALSTLGYVFRAFATKAHAFRCEGVDAKPFFTQHQSPYELRVGLDVGPQTVRVGWKGGEWLHITASHNDAYVADEVLPDNGRLPVEAARIAELAAILLVDL